MLLGFLNKYSASLPQGELANHGQVFTVGETGNWHEFLWDVLPQKEYSRAPSGWVDVSNLAGAELVVSGVARSEDGSRVIKIEFVPHFRKRNDLRREAEHIAKLNAAGCVSAPKLLSAGRLPLDVIREALPRDWARRLDQIGVSSFEYLTLEYVNSGAEAPIADILVALLEQKSLGVYHADVKPENIRFDVDRGVCILIDYDQAMSLPEDIRQLNASDFLRWCDLQDKSRYPAGPGTWRRHFRGLNNELHVKPLMRDGALDLAKTTPYRRQATTNTKNGVYHTIRHPIVFSDGVRDMGDRAPLLDQIAFAPGETVLDMGCNAGLLSHYLASRGCRPTGMELDPSIVVSAQMVANIMNVSARFVAQDLDEIAELTQFDTICLFSVIHHTNKLQDNGLKIAKACRRILIECRLAEHGKKPKLEPNGKIKWIDSSVWNYPTEADLFAGLSGLFPGFYVARKVGHADKNRMLLEMVKQ